MKCTTLYSVYVSIKYIYNSVRNITEACDLEDNIFLSYKHRLNWQEIVSCFIFNISLSKQEVILIECKVKKKIYKQNQECWRTKEVVHSQTLAFFFFFFRHIQHIRRVFLLLLSPLLCSPPLSPLVGFVFHEWHVKHTGHVEWNAVEMLIVRFISAETMREEGEEERRKKKEGAAEIPGKDSLQKIGLLVPSALCEVCPVGQRRDPFCQQISPFSCCRCC